MKAMLDDETGLFRTGLEEYLAVIFPGIDDWLNDKPLPKDIRGKNLSRPDWRSDKLELIIEFDGYLHYQKQEQVKKDIDNTDFYRSLGYKVIRIPFFIQLTNEVVEQLFGKKIEEQLFDSKLCGLPKTCMPSSFCLHGLYRLFKELEQFPMCKDLLENRIIDVQGYGKFYMYRDLVEVVENRTNKPILRQFDDFVKMNTHWVL